MSSHEVKYVTLESRETTKQRKKLLIKKRGGLIEQADKQQDRGMQETGKGLTKEK